VYQKRYYIVLVRSTEFVGLSGVLFLGLCSMYCTYVYVDSLSLVLCYGTVFYFAFDVV